MLDNLLFASTEPYASGLLCVDATHTLYWETCGNPKGLPVLFLHGGPGAGCSVHHRRFFDPQHYRVVLFDQRGAGRSQPAASVQDNTTPALVADIECLREHLGVRQWLVFGGSWGSTLALAYGQAHPERCLGFVLRGIFLCTPEEVQWFLHGMRWFFPQAHADFLAALPEAERSDPLQAYARRLFGSDASEMLRAARAWSRYESACLHLLPQPATAEDVQGDAAALALARLEAHYFLHGAFLDQPLLQGMDAIAHLPAAIVQGRYDVICPPSSAVQLAQAWPHARLEIVEDAGHSAFEPGIARALVAATERFRVEGRP